MEQSPYTSAESTSTGGTAAVPAPDYEPPIECVGTLVYDKPGLRRLFGWLLWGDFATSIVDRSAGLVVQAVLNSFNITNTAYALIGTVSSLFGFVVGPIVSYKSDRHRGPHGRRRPFLLYAVPISGALMVTMSVAPSVGLWLDGVLGAHSPGRWLHLVKPDCPTPSAFNTVLLLFGASLLVQSFVGTIVGATFGAFINDVVPHTVIGRFYGWWRVISLGIGAVFNIFAFSVAAAHYRILFVILSVVYGLGFFLSIYKVKEGEYPPPPANEGGHSPFVAGLRATKTYLVECYSKPFYLFLFLAGILAGFGASAIFSYPIFFARSLHWSDEAFGLCNGLSLLAGACISPVAGWLAQRYHPLRVSMLTLVVHACVVFAGGILIHDGLTFAIGYSTANILQMFYNTASVTTGNRLIPREKFAMIGSAGSNLGILMGMVYTPFLGWLLDKTHSHYQYTYIVSGFCDLGAIAAFMVVYMYFKKHGGDENYVAP
jgi:Na+/melibiose symporter-like transporter